MNLGRNVIKVLLFSANVVVAGLFLLTLLAARISPEKLILPAYLSLGLPFYILANLFFIVLWAIFRKWLFLLSLVTLIVGIDAVQVALPLNFRAQKLQDIESTEGYSLITYNTMANAMMATHSPAKPNPVIQYVLDREPDILCIQEYSACVAEEHINKDELEKIFEIYPYQNVYYHVSSSWSWFGVATFSKYPILKKGVIDLNSYYNTAIYTDIQLGDTVVRVFNCHLESNKLTESDKQMATRLREDFDTEAITGTTLHLSRKLGAAYRIRAAQSDTIAAHIARSPYPVMVVGDFNDVPYSYAYTKLRGRLKDVFQEMGFGFDYTFNESVFKFRIDHILYDPYISLKAFKLENDQKGSDHFPLYSKFTL
ncbi:MAG: endonuclease/exonuclease/phosphatase family protein [Paludibacter sp.]|nr:MAG: endonuclease/exonuclease/phosphatase family protein [Paludibacter sp.]